MSLGAFAQSITCFYLYQLLKYQEMYTILPESFTSVVLLVVCVILGNLYSEEIKML